MKQYRNGWADGPAYITQCPIKTGSSYTYDFNVTGQRGTLWWHAHIHWLRATVYGAIVIMPKPGTPFPFPQPNREEVLLLGGFQIFNQNRNTYEYSIRSHHKFIHINYMMYLFMSVCVAGEWWHSDVEELVKQGNKMGLPPNMSDAHTINGKPGPLFPCSEKRK